MQTNDKGLVEWDCPQLAENEKKVREKYYGKKKRRIAIIGRFDFDGESIKRIANILNDTVAPEKAVEN